MATKKKTNSKKATSISKKKSKSKDQAADKANRVFAIRVTDAELAAIHEAAGPRNATRFVRAIAAAFANSDVKAFEAVLKEAREARSS